MSSRVSHNPAAKRAMPKVTGNAARRASVVERPLLATGATHQPPDGFNQIASTPVPGLTGGRLIDPEIAAMVGARLNRDFGEVRVYVGRDAADSAHAIAARAYTVGRSIVFAEGEYAPRQRRGQWLLSHELHHVAYGDPGVVYRKVAAPTARKPKVMEVVLTVDDGPQPHTAPMAEMLEQNLEGKLRGATWFVQRNRIYRNGKIDRNQIRILASLQNRGAEIAIHSFSTSDKDEHKFWYPSLTKRSYSSAEEALEDLEAFALELRSEGIRVYVVRMPGGEYSEILSYLRKLKAGDPEASAKRIVRDRSYAGETEPERAVILYRRKLMDGIRRLGLTYLDWNGESSGVPAREDSVSGHLSPAHTKQLTKRGAKAAKKGAFEHAVDRLVHGRGDIARFVLLSHDSSSGDVSELSADLKQMEEYARLNNITIKYVPVTRSAAPTRVSSPKQPSGQGPPSKNTTPSKPPKKAEPVPSPNVLPAIRMGIRPDHDGSEVEADDTANQLLGRMA